MKDQNNELSRRTIVKGAAWSVPVIAAAVAAPGVAASGENSYIATIAGTGTNSGTCQLTLPCDATNVTYTVIGGGGAGAGDFSGTSNGIAAGGAGARLTGTLNPVTCSAPGILLTIIGAGGGGVNAGAAEPGSPTLTTNQAAAGGAGGKGYGDGGAGGSVAAGTTEPARSWAVASGFGGGGGSAILVGTTPVVVAGGGGGSGNTVVDIDKDTTVLVGNSATNTSGQNAYPFGAGTPGVSANAGAQSATGMPTARARGGYGAVGATGGVGGDVVDFNDGAEDGLAGSNFGAGGGDGATGVTVLGSAIGTTHKGATALGSGGGGGGYAGGGSGAGASTWAVPPGQEYAISLAAVGGGGAGSSYTGNGGGLAVTSGPAASANNGGGTASATESAGGVGSVTIMFTSSATLAQINSPCVRLV